MSNYVHPYPLLLREVVFQWKRTERWRNSRTSLDLITEKCKQILSMKMILFLPLITQIFFLLNEYPSQSIGQWPNI